MDGGETLDQHVVHTAAGPERTLLTCHSASGRADKSLQTSEMVKSIPEGDLDFSPKASGFSREATME